MISHPLTHYNSYLVDQEEHSGDTHQVSTSALQVGVSGRSLSAPVEYKR